MIVSMQPFMESECVENGSSTICEYIQYEPLWQDSVTLVLGLSIVISIMVASLMRYVFYRWFWDYIAYGF